MYWQTHTRRYIVIVIHVTLKAVHLLCQEIGSVNWTWFLSLALKLFCTKIQIFPQSISAWAICPNDIEFNINCVISLQTHIFWTITIFGEFLESVSLFLSHLFWLECSSKLIFETFFFSLYFVHVINACFDTTSNFRFSETNWTLPIHDYRCLFARKIHF